MTGPEDRPYRVVCDEYVSVPFRDWLAAETYRERVLNAGNCPHDHRVVDTRKENLDDHPFWSRWAAEDTDDLEQEH